MKSPNFELEILIYSHGEIWVSQNNPLLFWTLDIHGKKGSESVAAKVVLYFSIGKVKPRWLPN